MSNDTRRIAVRVSPDALRQIRSGHPWVFDGAIRSVSHDGLAGSLAVVFDDKRRFAAIGLYDPTSPIRVRILHVGGPRAIDEDFWTERLVSALDLRSELTADGTTNGYRCVHGENDGFPGLVVDRYDTTAVVKIYSAAWLRHLPSIVPLLQAFLPIERIVLRRGRNVDDGGDAATMLVGDAPAGPVEFLERGLRFEADVMTGQKTGHFLDQRENRALVGGLSEGADVLDVFCCTGGFSVHAAAGGAASVISVDRSGPALAAARRNMARNAGRSGIGGSDHDTIEGDAFDVLERLAADGRRFDVVVIDPPSFASRASQVDRALAAYGRLTESGLALVPRGGMLVQSSCSSRVDESAFHRCIQDGAARSGRRLEKWARTGHAVDHPVGFPEGRYLKTIFAKVDP
ncbi:MAG: class I SAM-dependent rRNA methyltransferase [Acidimicrobiales bacterium]